MVRSEIKRAVALLDKYNKNWRDTFKDLYEDSPEVFDITSTTRCAVCLATGIFEYSTAKEEVLKGIRGTVPGEKLGFLPNYPPEEMPYEDQFEWSRQEKMNLEQEWLEEVYGSLEAVPKLQEGETSERIL